MEFFVPAGNGAGHDDASPNHHHHHPTSSSSTSSGRPTTDQYDNHSPPAATHSSVDDKLAWLQQNLGAHMLDGASGSLTSAEIEAALAAMPHTLLPLLFTLTTQVRAFQDQNTELTFDVKKHRAEAERLMYERGSLYEKVDVATQDRQAAESMLSSLRAATAALEKRWSEEKSELNARLTRLTWKDLAIRAQLKKKDVEYEKLQKQLTRGGSSSGSKTSTGTTRGGVGGGSRVRSIDITPKPSAYSGSSGSSSSALVGDEASRAALAASDHRQALLMEENAELREMLRCLYAEIQGLQDQYGDLVEEVETSRVRHHEELTKARGGSSSPLPPLGGEEESIFFPNPTSRRFEEGAFEMPAEWLGRVVGEELRADMAELGRRYDRLREVVMGQQQQEDEQQGEEEEIAAALQELAAEKKALQRELRRTKTRLHETEEVVAQQEVVIKEALFGEEAGHGGQGRRSHGGEGCRRLSADSWMAENEQVGVVGAKQQREEKQEQQRLGQQDQATLEEIAEKLTADLMTFGMEDEQQDIAAAAAAPSTTGGASPMATALGFTPSKKVGAGGEKAARTPLRTLSGGGGNLLSPMLRARMSELDQDMCRHSSSSSENNGEGLVKGTRGGRSSLQAALGLLSPIEHHYHGDSEGRQQVPKKTL